MSRPTGEMRVERLPFTVYDVLGYLVPGAFSLWVALVFIKSIDGSLLLSSSKLDVVGGSSDTSIYLTFFIFVIVAYALGQLVGLCSSISVEKLAIEYFGYPSKFLTMCESHGVNREKIIEENRNSSSFKRWRIFFVRIFCWPLWLGVHFLISTKLYSIFMRPFSQLLIERLQSRLKSLDLEAGEFAQCEWWKGIEFYVINNVPHAFARMYNYLTIFGFFRQFSFIFVAVTWIYLIKIVWRLIPGAEGVIPGGYCSFIAMNWSWGLLWGAVGSGFIAFLFFLGFLKFFRRYSEEAILALCYFDGLKQAGGNSDEPGQASPDDTR